MPKISPRQRALVLLSSALLATTPILHAKDMPEPIALDAAFSPAGMADKVFTVTDSTALKGLGRVAVPLFTVEFVTADSVSASTSGFAMAGRATSSLYYRLQGVGEAEFQAMTNALYADFLRDLQASGLEVVPPAEMMASPTYSKLAASGSPAPLQSDNAITLAPPGMAVYGLSKAAAGGNNAGLFGTLASIGSSMAAVGAAFATPELSKELNATLLEVQMRVTFVQLTNHNKGFLGRISGTASTSGQVNPSVGSAMMRVQNGYLSSTLTMKNTLTLDNAAFADVRTKAATTSDLAGAVAVGLLRLAIGSQDSSSSEEMEVVADAVKYPEIVGNGLGNVREMLVQRLRSTP